MFDYFKSVYKVGDSVLVRCPNGIKKGKILYLSSSVIAIIESGHKRCAIRGCEIDYCEDYCDEITKECSLHSGSINSNKRTETQTNKASNDLTDEEEKEVEGLVNFFKSKSFTHSSEVSNYIRSHKLGNKFSHISGYLDLSDGVNNWTFEGGISPKYYAIICNRLGLSDNRSHADVTGFKSYKETNK